MIHVSELCL